MPAAMTSAPAMVTPRPNRGASRAAAAEETSTPTENGRKVSPACSGGEAQAELQEQGEHQAERGDAEEERHRDRHAHAERALAEQAQLDQRRAVPAGLAPLIPDERANAGRGQAMDTNVQAGQPNWRPCTSG